MSDKIKAIFGADVSEVEAKMLVATRATKSYENAVKQLSKADAGSGMAKNMGKTNEALGEISKKLTAGRIIESVLGGVGLGSGFQIAEKAAAFITSSWEEAAKSAERIASASEKATDVVMKRIALRETDEQALAKAKLRSERADRALMADTGEDPEATANLKLAAEEAALVLETLQKKAREKKKAEDEKTEKERNERELKWEMDKARRLDQQDKQNREDEKKRLEEIQNQVEEDAKKQEDAMAEAARRR